MRTILGFALLAIFALAGCKGEQKRETLIEELEGEWMVKTINGDPVSEMHPEKEVFIGFKTSEAMLYGCTGCNDFNAPYQSVEASRIRVEDIATTRMMCASMTTEPLLLDAIKNISHFEITETAELYFMDDKGNTILQLVKK